MILIDSDWKELLKDEISKPYFKNLLIKVREEYSKYTCYPKEEDIFNALNFVPFDKIKVVIIGQDPYHQPNQAHGLCFSVQKGVLCPPSLMNIKQELKNEFDYEITKNGDLSSWANQGVLLLNSILTVRQNSPLSHSLFGWQTFTAKILELINKKEKPVVFIAWGSNAKQILSNIDFNKHHLLYAPHPSPLSAYRGFLGCNHFKKANEILENMGQTPIDWKI